MIKVRGWQVSPAELEACLLTHPLIKDVAVIGVSENDGAGELPRAYIVPVDPGRTGYTISESECRLYANGRLAGYKSIDGGIRFVDELPRTSSGKIIRRSLKERARRETQAQ